MNEMKYKMCMYDAPKDNWNQSALTICRTWLKTTQTVANDALTFGALNQFIIDLGLDQSEYFNISRPMRDEIPDWENSPIWKDCRWISVFWVVGGSEGYYVHVERILSDTDARDLIFLGKFWTPADAQWVTTLVSTLINLWY